MCVKRRHKTTYFGWNGVDSVCNCTVAGRVLCFDFSMGRTLIMLLTKIAFITLVCDKPIITLSRETLIMSELHKHGCLMEFHKSSIPNIKTFYYLYILANKLISVHWLHVT